PCFQSSYATAAISVLVTSMVWSGANDGVIVTRMAILRPHGLTTRRGLGRDGRRIQLRRRGRAIEIVAPGARLQRLRSCIRGWVSDSRMMLRSLAERFVLTFWRTVMKWATSSSA